MFLRNVDVQEKGLFFHRCLEVAIEPSQLLQGHRYS